MPVTAYSTVSAAICSSDATGRGSGMQQVPDQRARGKRDEQERQDPSGAL